MTGFPSRTTSVTSARALTVIWLKSIYALRISDWMGTTVSRISTILTTIPFWADSEIGSGAL
jgi:hypothetical protein